ncbi:hypothetical protein SEA_ARCHIMEDES_8 [Gordonia phage Archimedes]|uniref:Uncharacterized protein n=1 Tax=Gordonia phage Archimedes TaxID=2759389 RepID=A0A7L7SKL6_9CAUD|nr:head-tail connector protein [Gordonia phage Archimedes]QOC55708.1 hypothetical protein SEA_ARCHIMEDES_8 [Gordonia phage Archimedes]
MKIVLDYDNDQILVDDKPLGLPLSASKVDTVFSGDDGRGVIRFFAQFDDIAIVPKAPVPPTVAEPDLMDSLSESDKFEVEMEKIRRGAGRG